MATIKDVARIAGVSVASVSRVLNNGPKVSKKTIENVLKAMKDLNYTPNANARALVTQRSTTIGVVIPDLVDPFFASLANGVEQVARQNNMQLLLSTGLVSAESEMQAINLLIERRCDVMVVHSKKLSDEALIALAKKTSGLVLIDRYIEEIAERCVWLDNLEGGKIAARHLLSLNHKSFACISSKHQIDDPLLRLQGFQHELKLVGADVDLIEYGPPTLQGGEIATQKLLASGKSFSALFVYNDAMAIGAISTLEDNGFKVPYDISVLGFDDVLLSRYSRPKLSTLNYPIGKMAIQATNIALELSTNNTIIDDRKNYKHIPRIIKRESTSFKSG
ncbi:LacI family DNA-binding transcriptional regulator [Pseudoalteromonas sp. SG44-5]|uniref:LacI family DNA-binding transcriptional regulator n=1 Tax=unclassified Pseudoalteromonas TaxID=194690 RepID=UPI0015FAF393|nr:LacI family DNA-binding transcriptional regulator [Pseudoalteromonas sp. SG44-5]MBB1405191.1 LacI family DNA-binding transcriptional regulator [Pseudoalteromonas sp. SG44-5]